MESAFSLLAKGFLTFSDSIVIAPLLIIGFFTQKRVFWGNASLLVLFTMIFNVFLKSLFLVPLDPALGIKGFAFPSGHMQASVALYGWVFLGYPHRMLRWILLIILTGIGYGLVQQGYHTPTDVGGAVVFGLATLYVFFKVTSFPSIQKNRAHLGFYLILLAVPMMGVIYMRTGIPPHIAKTFMGLVGFSVLWLGLSAFIGKK